MKDSDRSQTQKDTSAIYSIYVKCPWWLNPETGSKFVVAQNWRPGRSEGGGESRVSSQGCGFLLGGNENTASWN